MRLKIFIAAFLFLHTNWLAVAQQTLPKIKQEGLRLYDKGKYAEALIYLQQYQQKKGDDPEILKPLAMAAFETNKLSVSKQSFTKLWELQKSLDANSTLHLGYIFHAEMNFKEAIKYYKNYLRMTKENDILRQSVIEDIKRCAAGLKLEGKNDWALVENLGENVNTVGDETAPLQSLNYNDRLYFSANRPDASGGLRDKNCLQDVVNGFYFNDIYYTQIENGDWAAPVKLDNELINTSRNEFPLGFINKGKSFLFYRTLNKFSGDILIDTFKSENETHTNPPVFSAPLHKETADDALCVFNDTLIIFSSRRAGGVGGADLYYTVFRNNEWTTPINLGEKINSGFDETTPFLAQDGHTLYFSSNSDASMGGFDIFKSTFDRNTLQWSTPVNLGAPINSADNDTYFKITSDGLHGFLASDRKESIGGYDLYSVLFKKSLPEQTASAFVDFHTATPKSGDEKMTATAVKQEAVNIPISPIYYTADEDVVNSENINKLRNALVVLKTDPKVKLILISHTTEGEKNAFDLYFSIKRAEKIVRFFIENGIKSENILLKSVGSEYPIAVTILNGAPNPIGEKLNRRIDLRFFNLQTSLVNVTIETPNVSAFMVNPSGKKLDKHLNGLSYKVQVMTSKRLFDNDILSKYGDPMIEATGNEGINQYTIGLFSDYKSAEKLCQTIIKEGFPDAFVVPYVDGYRTAGDAAKIYVKQYPDLSTYLVARKKQ